MTTTGTDQTRRLLAMTAAEHLARAGELATTPVNHDQQTTKWLQVQAHLQFAIAKQLAGGERP